MKKGVKFNTLNKRGKMKKQIVYRIGIIIFTALFLLSCRSLKNDGGKDWIRVSVDVDQGGAKRSFLASSSGGSGTALIIAVPARVTSVANYLTRTDFYDRQLQDLLTGTVVLLVPMNEPLRLIKITFIGTYTTVAELVAAGPTENFAGISDSITITGADQVSVSIALAPNEPPWNGTIQMGTASGEAVSSLGMDSERNLYAAINSAGDFDDVTNTAGGSNDVYITKFSGVGVKQWTEGFGSNSPDSPNGILVDSGGNSYVYGDASGTIVDDTSTTSNNGNEDIMVAKCDSSGNMIFAESYGTGESESALGIGLASDGSIFLMGNTAGGLFGANTNTTEADLFLMKTNSTGSGATYLAQHSSTGGSPQTDEMKHAVMGSDGSIYLVGSTMRTYSTVNAGATDAIIAKWNSTDGSQTWAVQFGGVGDEAARRVVLDGSGHIYITGTTFNSLEGYANQGDSDIFVAKYDTSGNKIWYRQFGSAAEDKTWAMVMSSDGYVVVGGFTEGALPGQTNAGGVDILVAKYDTSGNQIWLKQFGTTGTDAVYCLYPDVGGTLFLGGTTEGSLADGLTPQGGWDAFIMKINSDGEIQ